MWKMFGRWVIDAIIKYVNIHAASGSVHIRSLTCPPDDFCIAQDTIAHTKVSGADSIAWRTQLHMTPAYDSLRDVRLKLKF